MAAQATFNILLNEVPGGDTIIYDRQWVAPDDDVNWRGQIARDTYSPQMCDGRVVKVMKATAGDLTVFNPRYVGPTDASCCLRYCWKYRKAACDDGGTDRGQKFPRGPSL